MKFKFSERAVVISETEKLGDGGDSTH
jgi:hypothetical protein